MVICLERGADLHMAHLMSLPLTVSCFSKTQIGFTFLVPAHPGSPGQTAVIWMCVCVAGLGLGLGTAGLDYNTDSSSSSSRLMLLMSSDDSASCYLLSAVEVLRSLSLAVSSDSRL